MEWNPFLSTRLVGVYTYLSIAIRCYFSLIDTTP